MPVRTSGRERRRARRLRRARPAARGAVGDTVAVQIGRAAISTVNLQEVVKESLREKRHSRPRAPCSTNWASRCNPTTKQPLTPRRRSILRPASTARASPIAPASRWASRSVCRCSPPTRGGGMPGPRASESRWCGKPMPSIHAPAWGATLPTAGGVHPPSPRFPRRRPSPTVPTETVEKGAGAARWGTPSPSAAGGLVRSEPRLRAPAIAGALRAVCLRRHRGPPRWEAGPPGHAPEVAGGGGEHDPLVGAAPAPQPEAARPVVVLGSWPNRGSTALRSRTERRTAGVP